MITSGMHRRRFEGRHLVFFLHFFICNVSASWMIQCLNVRDDLFLSILAFFFKKTHHPVQLASKRSRRGNFEDKMRQIKLTYRMGLRFMSVIKRNEVSRHPPPYLVLQRIVDDSEWHLIHWISIKDHCISLHNVYRRIIEEKNQRDGSL